MKTKILLSALTLALASNNASAGAFGKYDDQRVGTGLGMFIGTVVGGPIGAVVVGYLGNRIGESKGEGKELVQLKQEVNTSREELAKVKAENEQALKLARHQIDALKQQYAQTQMQYRQQMNAMQKRAAADTALAVSMQFRTGSAEIEPVYRQQLSELAQIMKTMDQYSLTLSGFADRQGEEKYNYQLSQNRAEAVKQYLVSQGIAAERIATKAYGETQPLQQQQTLQSDFFDRRVLIKLAPAGEAVAKN